MFQIQQQGAVSVISGDLPLNIESVGQVNQLCATTLQAKQPWVVVDLRRVPLIDSAGLEALLDLRDRCWRSGGAVVLSSPGHLCRDILMASGVEEQFAIYDTIADAVGSFSQ